MKHFYSLTIVVASLVAFSSCNQQNKPCSGEYEEGDGVAFKECSRCGGSGSIEVTCNVCDGNFLVDCSWCGGTGDNNCSACDGKGCYMCVSCGGEGYTQVACPDCGGVGAIY